MIALTVAATSPSIAQSPSQAKATNTQVAALPDAPGEMFRPHGGNDVEAATNASTSVDSHIDDASVGQGTPQLATASHLAMVIAPGQTAPQLSGRDKFVMGARDSVSLTSMAGWFISAGWSHLLDTSPNYGSDKGAFGQRLGAATVHGISEDVLIASVMAPVLHEDPRYYKMGRHGHSLTQRAVYAATRVFITRSDSGRPTANLALMTGDLEAAALTNAYYPTRNRTAERTMLTFGSSLGGAALSFGVKEFLGDALELAHLKKSE